MSGKTDAPEAPVGALDQVLAALQGIVERQDRLEAEVRQAASAAPAFVPMRQAGQTGASVDGRGLGVDAPSLARDGTRHLLTTTSGRLLTEMTLRQYPRRFGPGSPVRIDPASAREGFPPGRTWGDVLAEQGSAGVGEVAAIKGLRDKTGEWHYYVDVPGITGAQPDGFGDHELLPA